MENPLSENWLYLDDLDPETMTEEQKQAFQKMLAEDPYKFYSMWRDPDAAQIKVEGENFQTTPATVLYTQIGALKAAGAPDNVIDYWRQVLETSGRPNDVFAQGKTPRTKPVPEKLAKVEAFCQYLDEFWNIEDAGPAITDLNNPLADHWADVMNKALGFDQSEEPLHGVDIRHYQDVANGHASTGREVVEAKFYTSRASFDLQELNEIAQCDGFEIQRSGIYFIVKFFFYGCYE